MMDDGLDEFTDSTSRLFFLKEGLVSLLLMRV